MLIGTYQSITKMPELSNHINNKPLHKVTMSEYLGMLIVSSLKWDDHIKKMIFQLFAKIDFLRSLIKIVPTDTIEPIYNSIVQPNLNYEDAVLCKIRLHMLQTQTTRRITGSGLLQAGNPCSMT